MFRKVGHMNMRNIGVAVLVLAMLCPVLRACDDVDLKFYGYDAMAYYTGIRDYYENSNNSLLTLLGDQGYETNYVLESLLS